MDLGHYPQGLGPVLCRLDSAAQASTALAPHAVLRGWEVEEMVPSFPCRRVCRLGLGLGLGQLTGRLGFPEPFLPVRGQRQVPSSRREESVPRASPGCASACASPSARAACPARGRAQHPPCAWTPWVAQAPALSSRLRCPPPALDC